MHQVKNYATKCATVLCVQIFGWCYNCDAETLVFITCCKFYNDILNTKSIPVVNLFTT